MIARIYMLLSLLLAGLASGADLTSELIRRRDRSKSGVIALSDQDFSRFASTSSRPYSLVVFCNAKMKESAHLKMGEQFANFQVEALHVKKAAGDPALAAAANRVFFVAIEFQESQHTFARLGVRAIPWVLHFGPSVSTGPDGQWTIEDADRMKQGDYAAQVFSAADYADFVHKRTGHDFGAPFVPTFLQKPANLAIVAALLVTLSVVGWRVYTSSWIGHPAIWTAACLLVFWFAASGGLFNIIRGMPMSSFDREGKVQWFMPGQGQLGAEGFLMGSTYVSFAMCCFALTQLPRWFAGSKDSTVYRVVAYVLLLAAVGLFRMVVNFYTMKTGYRLRWYVLDWLRGVRL